MESIKVLHLIKTLNLGGAEKNLFNLVSSLDSNLLEIHVGYSYGGEFEERFADLGVRLFKFSKTNDKVKNLRSLLVILKLVKYIIANKIQIIHVHCFSTLVWGSIAAKVTETKLVEHVHDSRYVDRTEVSRRRGFSTQYKYAKYLRNVSDRVVVLTEQNRQFLLRTGFYKDRQIRKIQNGIPLNGALKNREETAKVLKTRLGLTERNQVILTSLRMSAEKNVDLIFRIAPVVTKAVPNAVFLLSGNGPQFDDFKAERERMNLSNIKLIGYYPEIYDLLALSDIFLLPSLLELHSIAILEAMSMKVPVVTSENVGCNDEFIASWKNGVLLDPFGDAGWAEAVVRLLREPDLRKQIGQNGYETCLNRFDIRKVVREFEDLYSELVRE